MATTQSDKPVDNGVNVEALFGAQAALKDAPEAAKFKWRSTVEWIDGTHSRSTIEGFYGLGAEQKHKKAFTFDADVEAAVGQRPSDAQQNVAGGELTPVQRDTCALVDLAHQQFRGTGDAAAVAAAIGQRHALCLQRVE